MKRAHPSQSVMTLRRVRIHSLYSTRGTTQIAESFPPLYRVAKPADTNAVARGGSTLMRGFPAGDFFRPARELRKPRPCSWLAPTANSLKTVPWHPLRQCLLIQIIISHLCCFVNSFIWVKPCKISCHGKQFFVVFYILTAYCAGSCR